MRPLKWVLIRYDWCPYTKKRLGHRHTESNDHVETQEKVAISKPRREVAEETNPVDNVILDF